MFIIISNITTKVTTSMKALTPFFISMAGISPNEKPTLIRENLVCRNEVFSRFGLLNISSKLLVPDSVELDRIRTRLFWRELNSPLEKSSIKLDILFHLSSSVIMFD